MPQDKPKPPNKIAGGKYETERKLGAGCFGEVWKGKVVDTGNTIAVKFEDFQSHALQLEHEHEILSTMQKPNPQQGFAEVYHFGQEGRYHCIVMELLGKSLEDKMQSCNGKFNALTTALIGEQVLQRIEYLHSRGIIHRDIKPENFMFGLKEKIHHLYIIDFGLSKKYYDMKHTQIRTKLSLTGTARYASINAHKGIEQSRRDDLEAIGHMLFYFLRGSLPWSGLDAKTQEEKYRKIREKKEETPLEDLCVGHPDQFKVYLRRTRDLEFKEKPAYNDYRKLFKEVRDAQGQGKEVPDHSFQWFEGKDLGSLTPLTHPEFLQPDDAAPSKGWSCCFCGGKAKVKD